MNRISESLLKLPEADIIDLTDSATTEHAEYVQMNLSLDPKLQKIIEERVKSGQYASAEDVVAAALLTLDQQERFGDFGPKELDELLAEGERSIEGQGTLDGDDAFRLRQNRRASKKNS